MAPLSFEEQLRRANITPDKPLHAVLTTVMQASSEAQSKRVAELAVAAVQRELDRMLWRARLVVFIRGMIVGAALLGAGYGAAKWEEAGFRMPAWGQPAPPPVRR